MIKMSSDDPIKLLIENEIRKVNKECSDSHNKNFTEATNKIYNKLESVYEKQDEIFERINTKQDNILSKLNDIEKKQIAQESRLNQGSGHFSRLEENIKEVRGDIKVLHGRIDNLKKDKTNKSDKVPWITKNSTFLKITIGAIIFVSFVAGFIFAGGAVSDLIKKFTN